MIKARGRSKSWTTSVLKGVVEVPAGSGLGASFRVRDIVPWMRQHLVQVHQPPASASKYQLPPNKKQLQDFFLSTSPHPVLCLHQSRFTWPKGQKDIHQISEISGMAGRRNLIFNLVISPYSLKQIAWAKISGVNPHTCASKSSNQTTCFSQELCIHKLQWTACYSCLWSCPLQICMSFMLVNKGGLNMANTFELLDWKKHCLQCYSLSLHVGDLGLLILQAYLKSEVPLKGGEHSVLWSWTSVTVYSAREGHQPNEHRHHSAKLLWHWSRQQSIQGHESDPVTLLCSWS